MKKLLFITPHFSTGGLPQFLLKKIQLLKNSYDVHVIEYENISNDFVVQKKKVQSSILSSRFHTIGQDKTKILKIISNINPDIIHMEEIPEMFMDYSVACDIYKKERNYIIIETTHDSSFDVSKKIFLPDKFSFVSPFSVAQFAPLGIPSELIEYPIDYNERPDRATALKKLGLDPNYKHILNVGLFTSRKNQSELFEVARKMEQYKIKFHFIGNQADNFKSYWEPLLKSTPSNCVIWGERNDVDNFYAAVDMMYFASRGTINDKETNPLVIRESIAWHLPIFMYNLDVYMNMYHKYDDIYYLCGDMNKDIMNIVDFLQLEKKEISMEQPKLKKDVPKNIFTCRYDTSDNKIFINNTWNKDCRTRVCIIDDDSNLTMYWFEMNIATGHEWWVRPIGNVNHAGEMKFRKFRIDIYDFDTDEQIQSSIVDVHANQFPLDDFKFKGDKYDLAWYNYYEFFYKKIYDNDIHINKDDVVVDIGANTGVFTRWALSKGAGAVYSIEASHKAYTSLYNTFIEDSRVKCIENAMHSTDDEILTFYDCLDNTTVSSLLPQQKESFKNERSFTEMKVKTLSFDGLLKRYDIKHINLLKMDIEGGEYEVFKNITVDYMKNHIDNIILEFHHNNNHELQPIIEKFENAGFEYYIYDYMLDNPYERTTKNIERGIICAYRVGKNQSKKIETPKIKVVHLLTRPDDLREIESIKSVSRLKDFCFEYIQNINEVYTKMPPDSWCNRPGDISEKAGHMKLTPAHFGCYKAHSDALKKELSSDYDFTIVCECDCIIDIPIEEFVKKVYHACNLMNKKDYYWTSFGYRETNVPSVELDEYFNIEHHQAWAHCYMVNNKFKTFYQKSVDTIPWDVADLWYNLIFADEQYKNARLITKIPFASQFKGGYSLLDKMNKEDGNFSIDSSKFNEKRKLRIAQIATGVIKIPPNGWGAIEKIIWNYKLGLEKLGHTVDIKYMDDDLSGYDIVHAHIANQAKFVHDKGYKYIFSMHDHHTTIFGKESQAYRDNLFAIENSKISMCFAKYVQNQFENHSKLQYMTHGVDIDFYNMIERVDWVDRPKLLCVGNNGIIGDANFDRKGFIYGLETANRLGCKLVIAGPRNNNETYLKQWGDLSKYKNLLVLYNLTDEELRWQYQDCDILVHMSSIEAGQPCLTISEALSCGLPVVGTSVDKIEKGMHFVERDDANGEDTIKKVVNAVLDVRNNYTEYTKNARKFAEESLDWNHIVKSLEEFYYKAN